MSDRRKKSATKNKIIAYTAAIIIHVLIIGAMIFNFTSKPKTVQAFDADTIDVVKATTIDESQIKQQQDKIKQKDIDKKRLEESEKKRLQKLKEQCENDYQNIIHVYSVDFLSSNFELELNQALSNHKDHFDIVINNAGTLVNEPFVSTSIDQIRNTYQINVFGPIKVIQSVVPLLNNVDNCHIINIGSMGGFQGSAKFSGLSVYSSSKAALANLTECLAEEYKETNVKLNCLALGSVQTDMLNDAFPGFKAQMSPSEMAKYIYNFSVMKPIYINGKVIPVSNSTP